MKPDRRHALLTRGCLLALLIALAGLAILAKTSQYLPRSNPRHYINAAVKMKTQVSLAVEQAPLVPTAKITIGDPLQPSFGERAAEVPALELSGAPLNIQDRSPPPF